MFEQLQQWELDRLGKFTASEIWKLMEKGKSGYFGKGALTYIRQKAAEILTLEQVNGGRINSQALEWGNAHEYEAVKELESKGNKVEYYGGGNPKFFEFTPFTGGSPDGIIDGCAVLEIKCPFNSAEHIQHLMLDTVEDLKDYAPEYYWQITANMVFTGLESSLFVSYDPRFADDHLRLKTLQFQLNEADKDLLLERLSHAEKTLAEMVDKIRKIKQ